MFDEAGKQVTEAGPSTPVEVLGLDDVPLAGDELRVAPNEKVARAVAEARALPPPRREPHAPDDARRWRPPRGHLRDGAAGRDRHAQPRAQGRRAGLARGAHRRAAQARPGARRGAAVVRAPRASAGSPSPTSTSPRSSNATVIGFNVRPDRQARELAESEQVDLRLYEVIYEVLDDVSKALLGMLKPEYEEVVTGDAEVREIFGVPAGRQGGRLLRAQRRHHPRLEGPVPARGHDHLEGRDRHRCAGSRTTSARSGRASSAASGSRTSPDLKPGDVIETFEEREIARVLTAPPAATRRRRPPMRQCALCTRSRSASISTSRRAGRSRRSARRSGRSSTGSGTASRCRWPRSTTRTSGSGPRSGWRWSTAAPSHLEEVMASVERFVAAAPDVELLDIETAWLESTVSRGAQPPRAVPAHRAGQRGRARGARRGARAAVRPAPRVRDAHRRRGEPATSATPTSTTRRSARAERARPRPPTRCARRARRLRPCSGSEVRLKYMPELRFRDDPAIAQGQRIEAVIRSIHDGAVVPDEEGRS